MKFNYYDVEAMLNIYCAGQWIEGEDQPIQIIGIEYIETSNQMYIKCIKGQEEFNIDFFMSMYTPMEFFDLIVESNILLPNYNAILESDIVSALNGRA
jgi:hypothetical protein